MTTSTTTPSLVASSLLTPRRTVCYAHCGGDSWWPTSALFLAFFGLLFFLHLGLAIRYKSRLMIPLLIAGFLEAAGYALKLVSASGFAYDTGRANWYLVWNVILLSAPFLINATIYALLRRLHAHFTPHTPLLNCGHLFLPILSYFDILPFILQVFGLLTIHGALPAPYSHGATPTNGTYVLFASQILQFIPLLIFSACLVTFHLAANRAVHSGAIILTKGGSRYKGLLHALYWTICMLLLRLTYYTYNAGTSSDWLPTPAGSGSGRRMWMFKYNELVSLIVDAAAMCVVFIAFVVAHPGRFLRRADVIPRTGWHWRVWRGGAGARFGGRTEEFRLDNELSMQGGPPRSWGNPEAGRGAFVA